MLEVLIEVLLWIFMEVYCGGWVFVGDFRSGEVWFVLVVCYFYFEWYLEVLPRWIQYVLVRLGVREVTVCYFFLVRGRCCGCIVIRFVGS